MCKELVKLIIALSKTPAVISPRHRGFRRLINAYLPVCGDFFCDVVDAKACSDWEDNTYCMLRIG